MSLCPPLMESNTFPPVLWRAVQSLSGSEKGNQSENARTIYHNSWNGLNTKMNPVGREDVASMHPTDKIICIYGIYICMYFLINKLSNKQMCPQLPDVLSQGSICQPSFYKLTYEIDSSISLRTFGMRY